MFIQTSLYHRLHLQEDQKTRILGTWDHMVSKWWRKEARKYLCLDKLITKEKVLLFLKTTCTIVQYSIIRLIRTTSCASCTKISTVKTRFSWENFKRSILWAKLSQRLTWKFTIHRVELTNTLSREGPKPMLSAFCKRMIIISTFLSWTNSFPISMIKFWRKLSKRSMLKWIETNLVSCPKNAKMSSLGSWSHPKISVNTNQLNLGRWCSRKWGLEKSLMLIRYPMQPINSVARRQTFASNWLHALLRKKYFPRHGTYLRISIITASKEVWWC